MADIHGTLRDFFLSLAEVLAAGAATRADAAAVGDLARLAAVLRAGPPLVEPVAPRHSPDGLPVCRFWEQALGRAADSPAALAEHLCVLGPALRWTQNPNYRRQPPDSAFLENYGYSVIAGPVMADRPETARPLMAAEHLAVGVLLLGPGTHYPAHHHPASEVYCIVSGDSEWSQGNAHWRSEPPGAVIHHPPNLSHAMRAGAEPLLAVYLWRGDLATHARLLERDHKED